MESSFRTTLMHQLLERARRGDDLALDELIGRTSQRLETLARSMLRRFPGVARWEQTGDVLQNATLRLLRALKTIQPESVTAFMGLAATQMRRELLDLARHYQQPHRQPAPLSPDSDSSDSPAALQAPADDPDELELWSTFHEAVETLPSEEREVIGLTFYHGCTQPEVADLLHIHERTVRRRWHSACMKLYKVLGGRLPEV